MPHSAPRSLESLAWRLVGLTGTDPGVLSLRTGRLRFETDDGVVFDVPLAAVTDVVFPWYYVGGGVKLTAGGERYRLSFVRPNGANTGELRVATRAVHDIGEGRAAGKAWRAALDAGTS